MADLLDLDGIRRRGAAARPPFRVVVVDHVGRLSGGEIALARLLQAVRGDVEPLVILGEDGPLRPRLEAAGATVRVLPMPPGLRDARRADVTPARLGLRRLVELAGYVRRLRREIRRAAPDLVHTNSLKAAVYGGIAGRLAGVPVVWHLRDRIAADYLPRPAVAAVRLLARFVPTSILANSRATLATLPRLPRSTVLSNPIVRDVAPTPVPRHEMRSAAPAAGPLRVGILGRLSPWKGHRIFLEAVAIAFPHGTVEARTVEARIIGGALFGEEQLETELRAYARELGIADDVVWRGFREDVAAELAELDILVHASTVPEPFGQVIVEGLAAGVPVIAAAAGGPLEILTHGVDGLLVAPGDAAALAEALKTLAADPGLRRRLVTAGQETIHRFSPDAAREQLLRVYHEVLR